MLIDEARVMWAWTATTRRGVKQSVEGPNDPARMCAWYGNGSSVK